MADQMKAKKATSTGDVVSGGCTLYGITITPTGTAGQLVLKDGSGGSTKVDIETSGGNRAVPVQVPDDGMKFDSALHLGTLSNISAITFWYKD